ncbi:MAG: amidohydrolase [Synergistaceae bacterium]|nr:amidohydrolase [Synergistaceae bacterium]
MDKDEIKKQLCSAVDASAQDIKAYADDIAVHPELGFAEKRTSARLAEELEKLGLSVRKNIAVTGLRTDIESGKQGPRIAVLGELDGVTCRAHPQADPITGASHSCGHNLQTSIVLAVAAALAKTGLMSELSGSVSLMGTPAEEFIEITHRKEMRDNGEIYYFCGKPEFIRLGEFDNVDMAMMIHAGEGLDHPEFSIPDTGNGFRTFMLNYKGRQAHAAAAPHKGVNALYAAVAGINAVNALRETFRDEDHVRVHFIITKGGDSVNSVPDDVRLEGYVRAGKAERIDETFDKVINAFRAGATALGAECFVASIPGDMPLNVSKGLNEVFAANAAQLVGPDNVARGINFAASTDMGDVMHIMPAIHPFAGGVTGALHSQDFKVLDFEAAVLTSAKAILMSLVDLLADNAAEAKRIIDDFKPVYTKEEYLAAMDRRFFSEI